MNDDLKGMLETVIKESLQPIEKELLALKKEVTDIKVEQQKTNEHLTGLESKQHIIYEQTGKLTEYHTKTMARLYQLVTNDDMSILIRKSPLDREIFKIKNA